MFLTMFMFVIIEGDYVLISFTVYININFGCFIIFLLLYVGDSI